MAEEKRGFFRRNVKKDDEAVVENPTTALSADLELQIAERFTESTPQPELSEQNAGRAAPIMSSAKSPSTKESLVQEKIQALVKAKPAPAIKGWNNDMEAAPIDGQRVMVSEDAVDRGVLVYWRISKFVDKKHLRYVPKGRWTDFLSKRDIEFVPKYWKAYNPEDYWPLQEKKA